MTAGPAGGTMLYDVRPIAGVPFEYQIEDGIPIVSPDTEVWRGSRALGEPVIVEHRLGDCSVDGMRLVMEAPPWSAYFADLAGRVHALFHEIVEAIPRRLLRTIEPGRRYEVLYERLPGVPVEQRDIELALITLVLAAREMGILAHGCGYLLPSGRAVLSPGISGAGKSTLGRLLSRHAEVAVLNDDRVVVADESPGHGFRAWGTPWPGQGGVAHALDAPLRALAFIRQAERCEVLQVESRDAARRLYRMLALPLWSGPATAEALDRVERMVTQLPLFELAYPPTEEAARWIVSTLTERTDDA
jgi:hypothetical protein